MIMKSRAIRKGSRVAGRGLVRFIAAGLKIDVPRKSRGKLYAGDAGWCPRKSALFSLRDGRNVNNAASQFYMETGTTVHRLIQKGLENVGVLVEAERRIDYKIDNVQISGMIDGVVEIDDEISVLEIKTCGALPSKPKKEHKHQAMVYALLSGIYKIIIFYFSRSIASYDGTLTAVEFEVLATPDELAETAHLLAESVVATKMGVIPRIPPHITSASNCGFCPFQKSCWEGDETFKNPPKKFDLKVAEIENELLKRSKKAHREYE